MLDLTFHLHAEHHADQLVCDSTTSLRFPDDVSVAVVAVAFVIVFVSPAIISYLGDSFFGCFGFVTSA